MALNFICGLYLDQDCSARLTAESKEELMALVIQHAKEAHGMDPIPTEKQTKIDSRFSGLSKDSAYGKDKW